MSCVAVVRPVAYKQSLRQNPDILWYTWGLVPFTDKIRSVRGQTNLQRGNTQIVNGVHNDGWGRTHDARPYSSQLEPVLNAGVTAQK